MTPTTEAGKRLLTFVPPRLFNVAADMIDSAAAILAIEAEARADALRDAAEKVEGLPVGWTRPDDQFGPKQYPWLYRSAVLTILRGTPEPDTSNLEKTE